MPGLHDWDSFYVITGSSAAALTGLMFVVITLTSERVRGETGALRAFATPTIVHFCAVLLLAGIMTTPHQSPRSLGWCLGLTGLAGLGYLARVMVHMQRQTQYAAQRSDVVWYVVLPVLSYALLLGAALLLRAQPDGALVLAGVFTMGMLLVGIHNAWDSAVWIATMHRPPG